MPKSTKQKEREKEKEKGGRPRVSKSVSTSNLCGDTDLDAAQQEHPRGKDCKGRTTNPKKKTGSKRRNISLSQTHHDCFSAKSPVENSSNFNRSGPTPRARK